MNKPNYNKLEKDLEKKNKKREKKKGKKGMKVSGTSVKKLQKFIKNG